MFVVAETSVRYLAPARLDDELRITTQVLESGRASMTLHQQAWRDAVLLAEGTIRIGCVHDRTLRPTRLPPLWDVTTDG
jgi:acyl-CoA thioester hydrolase